MPSTDQAKRFAARRLAIAGAIAFVAIASGLAVSPSQADPPGETTTTAERKVTICHATNADENPYNRIEVDESSVDGVGGADHYGTDTGPIWDSTLKDLKITWGDIIPPVAPFHAGLNWTAAGQAIWNLGCSVVAPTTTTTVAPTTTTVPPTTTTVPPTSTTVAPTTTTVAPTTTTTVAAVVLPEVVEPCAFDPGLASDDPACVPPAEVGGIQVTPPSGAAPQALPRTGVDVDRVAGFAAALTALGLAALGLGRRRAARG